MQQWKKKMSKMICGVLNEDIPQYVDEQGNLRYVWEMEFESDSKFTVFKKDKVMITTETIENLSSQWLKFSHDTIIHIVGFKMQEWYKKSQNTVTLGFIKGEA